MKETTEEILKIVIKHKPRLNAQDKMGRTALHFACRGGRTDLVKILAPLEGIDVNRRTVGGETPLMCAAQSGNIFVVGECLNNNFNPFL